jgi:hypothetical protein
VEKQTAFSHRSHSPYCYFTFHLHKRFDTFADRVSAASEPVLALVNRVLAVGNPVSAAGELVLALVDRVPAGGNPVSAAGELVLALVDRVSARAISF